MKFINPILFSLLLSNPVFAVTAIDLRHQPVAKIEQYIKKSAHHLQAVGSEPQLEVKQSYVDFNGTTHVRYQQFYQGLPIWNATSVLHVAKSANKNFAGANGNLSMNGIVYEGLEKELAPPPSYLTSPSQQTKAERAAQNFYAQKNALAKQAQHEATKTVVFIDDKGKAHYGYLISFYVNDHLTGAHRPTVLMDADTFKIYRDWDQVKYQDDTNANKQWLPKKGLVGGIGGNGNVGQKIYDGARGHLPAFELPYYTYATEDEFGRPITVNECFLESPTIKITDVAYDNRVVMGFCQPSRKHNNVFWLSLENKGTSWPDDEMNGGFSPALDAFYAATIINQLYQDWYGIPALVKEDGKTPMQFVMRVHYGRKFQNAFWDGRTMTFGDGAEDFYPLVSLDVSAHEISHGFTEQHSGLNGTLAMDALHESFSDMASAATEFYSTGKNTWQTGRSISKNNQPLRYLDNPKKDGKSIDHASDLRPNIFPHYAAGIFTKAFYLIATSPTWDTRKAFNIMVKANMHYWTSSMRTFEEAACGVLSATQDYHYPVKDVVTAFDKVGIDTSEC